MAGGTTTNFQLTGNVALLERQGTTTTAAYTDGNELLRKDGEYPMLDGLGSERTVANSSQAVTGTVNYDAFGNTVGTSGSSTDPYMFAGPGWAYRNDADAGLMLVGARCYDAQVGRLITRDTDLSQAPYLYCGGDPVNAVDPSGHNIALDLPQTNPLPRVGTGIVIGVVGIVSIGWGAVVIDYGIGLIGGIVIAWPIANIIGGVALIAIGIGLIANAGNMLGWWDEPKWAEPGWWWRQIFQ